MKKMLLIIALSLNSQWLIFGSSSSDSASSNDSLKNEKNNPILLIRGAKVYIGDSLLTKRKVLNILESYPAISSSYEKGRNLRNTGIALIAGSIVSMTGGIVIMVDGILMNTAYNGYQSESDIGYSGEYYLGLAVLSLGELMLDGGIACSIVGKIKIKRSIHLYNLNKNTASNNIPGKINYQLGLLGNGNLGLKVTF